VLQLGGLLDGEAEHPLQHRELAIDLAGRHRFVTYAGNSVVVIVIIRRLPKNGERLNQRS
jgi:hypothetical protein